MLRPHVQEKSLYLQCRQGWPSPLQRAKSLPPGETSLLRALRPSFATSHFGSQTSQPGAQTGLGQGREAGVLLAIVVIPTAGSSTLQCHGGQAEIRISCGVKWGHGGFSW